MTTLRKEHPASDCNENIIHYTIKCMASMACFESGHLKFVDIPNFIAPGSNYAGYLKAFGAEEPKGFFPFKIGLTV